MLRGWNCWNGKRSADSLHAVGCQLPLRLPSAEPWPLPSPRRLLREVRPKVSPYVTNGNKLPNKEEAQEAQDAHETWTVLPPSRTWDSYVWLVRRGLFISTAQAAQDIQCLLNWRLSDWAVAGLVVSLHDGRDSRVALPWFATNFQIQAVQVHLWGSCHIVSHCVTLCHIVSHCVTLCHIVSHCVTLCHIVSHCVTLCHIVSHCP